MLQLTFGNQDTNADMIMCANLFFFHESQPFTSARASSHVVTSFIIATVSIFTLMAVVALIVKCAPPSPLVFFP